jgi:REP element-mobilizing transposase RayT
MSNTYTSLHYHFTFSTKNREPWIAAEIENRVWAYIGGIARHHKMTALQVGGIEDHVHALESPDRSSNVVSDLIWIRYGYKFPRQVNPTAVGSQHPGRQGRL